MAASPRPAHVDRSASPLDRARAVDRCNALLAHAWEKRWSPRPTLDPDSLLATASAGLGDADFADRADWLARLGDLAEALESEAQLNPLGRTMAHGQIVRALRQRLGLERLWRRRPEILEVPVARPIIVLGQMRSGTTRMQRMLAADRRLAATRFCDGWNALPPRLLDHRPLAAALALRLLSTLNPRFGVIHPTSPRAVDEEIAWLGLGLSTTPYDAQWRVPSFVAANEGSDALPIYRLLRRIVQTDIWYRRHVGRVRILKVPQFMEDVDALLSVFPDARIVHVTRDPAAVVGSSCSLVANQMVVQSDVVCPAAIGREWLRKTQRRAAIANRRLARGDVAVATVGFEEMTADWRAAMADIYRMLDLPLPAERDMAAMAAVFARPPGRNRHHYRLEDFGLGAAAVRRAFAA